MIPKVKFDLNKQLDIQMTYSFLGWSIGGVSFDNSIFGTNPELKKVNTTDINEVKKYFKNKYKELEDSLKNSLKTADSIWKPIEPQFIRLITQVFKGYEFPDGKYICYLSLTDCNPRFLEDKTFQMYYKAYVPARTISHELTHFLFYDYTLNKHPQIFRDLDPNQGVYWSLAELFNNVILSFSDFTSLLDNQGDGPYPEHEEHYLPLVNLWNKNRDIDKFIVEAFEYLKTNLKE